MAIGAIAGVKRANRARRKQGIKKTKSSQVKTLANNQAAQNKKVQKSEKITKNYNKKSLGVA